MSSDRIPPFTGLFEERAWRFWSSYCWPVIKFLVRCCLWLGVFAGPAAMVYVAANSTPEEAQRSWDHNWPLLIPGGIVSAILITSWRFYVHTFTCPRCGSWYKWKRSGSYNKYTCPKCEYSETCFSMF